MEQELPKIEVKEGHLVNLDHVEPMFDPGCQHELALEEFDGTHYSYKCKKCPRGILTLTAIKA